MELLTSPGGVNGSTPDRALLAAQIRASFESLVRASPSPMIMERSAVLRLTPARPQQLTWGSPGVQQPAQHLPPPASVLRPVPRSQHGQLPSPLQLTMPPAQPSQAQSAGVGRSNPATAHATAPRTDGSRRLGGLHTPVTGHRDAPMDGGASPLPLSLLTPQPRLASLQSSRQHHQQQQPGSALRPGKWLHSPAGQAIPAHGDMLPRGMLPHSDSLAPRQAASVQFVPMPAASPPAGSPAGAGLPPGHTSVTPPQDGNQHTQQLLQTDGSIIGSWLARPEPPDAHAAAAPAAATAQQAAWGGPMDISAPSPAQHSLGNAPQGPSRDVASAAAASQHAMSSPPTAEQLAMPAAVHCEQLPDASGTAPAASDAGADIWEDDLMPIPFPDGPEETSGCVALASSDLEPQLASHETQPAPMTAQPATPPDASVHGQEPGVEQTTAQQVPARRASVQPRSAEDAAATSPARPSGALPQQRPMSPAAAFASQRARARMQAAGGTDVDVVEPPGPAAKRRATGRKPLQPAAAAPEAPRLLNSAHTVKQPAIQPVEARRSSRRRVAPLDFWRGQVVLRDPASGDAVDIAEGAPDYITGVPRVKAESSDSPQAPGREPDSSRGKHGSKGASSSRPAAEQGGTGRQGGGKKRPAPSSVRSMGNQPRAFGGRFAPKQQASRQVADTAELAMADVQQRGGRGGRHPRSAAVAAAGFAAAAVAANKGGLRRKASPGPADAARARQRTHPALGSAAQLPPAARKGPAQDAGQAFARLDGLADAALAAEQLGGSSSRSAGRKSKSQLSGGAQQRSGKQQAGSKRKRLQHAAPADKPYPGSSVAAHPAAALDEEAAEADIEGVTPPSKQRKRSRTDSQPAAAPASKQAPSKHRQIHASNGKATRQLSASGSKPAFGREPASNRTAHVCQPSRARAAVAMPQQQQQQQQQQPQQPQGHQRQQQGNMAQRQGAQPAGHPATAVTPHPRTPAAPSAPADTSWTSAQEAALAVARAACDPTSRNYWQAVAKRVPGKSAQQCYDKALERHPTPKASKRSAKQLAAPAAVPLPKGRKDGKPGAAVRKYVHEVQLQEHLDNMRATQQQLSPEGSDGEREAELQAAEATRRQKQRYVDGFKRRHLGTGRQPSGGSAPRPAAPLAATLRPVVKNKIGVAAMIELAIAKGSGAFLRQEDEEDSDEEKDLYYNDDE